MIHMRLRLCLSLLAGSLPDLPHGFGQAHIVGLELIVSPSNDKHGKHVGVFKGLTPAGHAPFRKVVGYYVPSGFNVSMAIVVGPKRSQRAESKRTGSRCKCG